MRSKEEIALAYREVFKGRYGAVVAEDLLRRSGLLSPCATQQGEGRRSLGAALMGILRSVAPQALERAMVAIALNGQADKETTEVKRD